MTFKDKQIAVSPGMMNAKVKTSLPKDAQAN